MLFNYQNQLLISHGNKVLCHYPSFPEGLGKLNKAGERWKKIIILNGSLGQAHSKCSINICLNVECIKILWLKSINSYIIFPKELQIEIQI